MSPCITALPPPLPPPHVSLSTLLRLSSNQIREDAREPGLRHWENKKDRKQIERSFKPGMYCSMCACLCSTCGYIFEAPYFVCFILNRKERGQRENWKEEESKEKSRSKDLGEEEVGRGGLETRDREEKSTSVLKLDIAYENKSTSTIWNGMIKNLYFQTS